MADDSDESVLFENSALHNFLKSVGQEDACVKPLQKSLSNTTSQSEEDEEDGLFVQRFCNRCVLLVLSVLPFKTNCINKLNRHYQDAVFRKLVTSTVLLDMDADFLDELDKKDPPSCKTVLDSPRINIGLSSVFLVCVLAYLVSRCMQKEAVHWISHPILDILIFVITTVTVTVLVKDARIFRWQKYGHGLAQSYGTFVLTSEQLSMLVKKSLQFVQERELIARGFSLVPAGCAVSQLLQSVSSTSPTQCPQLRKQIFLTLRAGVLACRKATLQIIQKYPLQSDVDMTSNYVATICLEEYGPCLQVASSDDIQLLGQLTDNFSLSALKAMSQLFSLHLSQFVRRLALCFNSASAQKDPFVTLHSVQHLHDSMLLEKDVLQQCLDNHRPSYARSPSRGKASRGRVFSKVAGFHSCVHSLDLRLQSTLTRVQHLSSQLELVMEAEHKTEAGSGSVDRDLPRQHDWLTPMANVQSELQACQECWEEAVKKIKKPKSVPQLDDMPQKIQQVPQAVVSETDDYVIEDQVFEAYADPDETSAGREWDCDFSIDEKEKRRKERDVAVSLLTELRSAISVRAEEMKKREEIALSKVLHSSEVGDQQTSVCPKNPPITHQDDCHSEPLMESLSLQEVDLIHDHTECRSVDTDLSGLDCKEERYLHLSLKQQDSKSTASEGTELSDGSSVEIISNWSSDEAQNSERQGFGTDSVIDFHLQQEFVVAGEDLEYVSDLGEGEDSVKSSAHSDSHTDSSTAGFTDLSETLTKADDEYGNKDRVACLPGSSIAFTTWVADMVALRSQKLNLNIETFADSGSDDCDSKHDDDEADYCNVEDIATDTTTCESEK